MGGMGKAKLVARGSRTFHLKMSETIKITFDVDTGGTLQ